MAGTNGNGKVEATADEVMSHPTIEELRRAYQEGLPLQLVTGLEVVMRPVQAEKLLWASNIPNQLTQLVMTIFYPPPKPEPGPETFPDEKPINPVLAYLSQQREQVEEFKDFVESVNIVCEAALVDPSILPYLELSERMDIFRLAFYPVAVLSRFREKTKEDVGTVADSEGDEQPTEQPIAVDAKPV